ncbi:MAG: Xaa-Pro peptidase family protein [Candidatus Aenigmarchaeota archaeon]|nr:Xaa-Pro peptidase family protein [Candidatus Aenigmarchaeota archaeon]
MNELKLLKATKVDGILLFSSENCRDVNFDYFSDFRKPTYSFYLFSKKPILITSSIDYERALKETNKEVIRLKDYNYNLRKILKQFFKGKKIGVISSKLPLSLAKSLRGYKLVDISEDASKIRAIKNKKEIKLIKTSCKIANKGIDFIRKNLSLDKKEKDFVEELHEYLKRFDIEGFSFDTIFSSGKRSAFIHPYPSISKNKISKGLGLIDFGVIYKGYCSDVTVPFSFGKLNERQQRIVQTVLECYDFCKIEIRENLKAEKIFIDAENFIKSRGFEFKHGLGHGLGLEVHDSPSLSLGSRDILKKNMVITVEPGIYEVDIGGFRLENDFIIHNKAKVLTKSRYLEF